MQDYDITIKNLLTKPGNVLLELLTGTRDIHWMNVELPRVSNRRRDLLGELPTGDLIGIEIQTENQADFGFRIGEYQYGVANRFGRMPGRSSCSLDPTGSACQARSRGRTITCASTSWTSAIWTASGCWLVPWLAIM